MCNRSIQDVFKHVFKANVPDFGSLTVQQVENITTFLFQTSTTEHFVNGDNIMCMSVASPNWILSRTYELWENVRDLTMPEHIREQYHPMPSHIREEAQMLIASASFDHVGETETAPSAPSAPFHVVETAPSPPSTPFHEVYSEEGQCSFTS